MKWIIILVLILILVAMIAYRYRQQIKTAWFMWQAFRKFRQQAKAHQAKTQQKQVPDRDTRSDSELVRCPKCNKWTPQDEAVKLKSNYYCSLPCLEESISVKS